MKNLRSLSTLRHASILLGLPLVLSGAEGAPNTTMLAIGGGAAVVVVAGAVIASRVIAKKKDSAPAPKAKAAPTAGRTAPLAPPKREAAAPPRPAAPPPRPAAPPPPAAAKPEAAAPPPPPVRQVPAIELAQPEAEVTFAPAPEPTPAPAPEPAPAAAAKAPLFDADKLDSSLDDLFGIGGEAAAAPVAPAPAPEPAPAAAAKAPLFDADKLDSSLDDLFGIGGEPAPAAAPAPEPEPAPAAAAKSPLFDADKLDSSLDDLFGLGGEPAPAAQAPTPEPVKEVVAEAAASSSKTFDPALTLSSFDLSSFSLDAGANPLQSSSLPGAAPAAEPEPAVAMTPEPPAPEPLPTVSQVVEQPAAPKPAAPQQDGLISIGKLLVDQNTLEEIIRTAEKGGKGGLTTTQVITAVKGKSLDTVLEGVNTTKGVIGSLIVGRDGLVITNTMPSDIDKDLVGALTSSLFANTDIQIKRMQRGLLKRLVLETDTGMSVLAQLEMGTLVVFAKPMEETDLNAMLEAVAKIAGTK